MSELTYLESMRITCRAELRTSELLLEAALTLALAEQVRRHLEHALSSAQAMENELRGVGRPVTSRG